MLAGAAGPRGRARTAVVSLPGRSERLHLRPVHHGGWLRPLLRDRLLGLARPLAELRAHARLRALGAPVPIPVLVAARRVRGFHRAAVATIHEEGRSTASRCSRPARRGGSPAGSQRGGLGRARAPRRRRASRGSPHREPALPRAGRPGRGLVVDLDRARIPVPLAPPSAWRELMRLHRSLVKCGLSAQVVRAASALLRVLHRRGSGLRGALLRRLPRERARLAIHALGWRLGLS